MSAGRTAARPLPTALDEKTVARFWAKVDRCAGPDACWPWTASRSSKGYGMFRLEGRLVKAHRLAYVLATGADIPANLDTDHGCRRRECVNARHLEPVSNAVNIARGASGFALTGLCRAGLHRIDRADDIYVFADGGRRCRQCRLASRRLWRAHRRAERELATLIVVDAAAEVAGQLALDFFAVAS